MRSRAGFMIVTTYVMSVGVLDVEGHRALVSRLGQRHSILLLHDRPHEKLVKAVVDLHY
jgi:hypothetical protein